jgi:hypothetical protein
MWIAVLDDAKVSGPWILQEFCPDILVNLVVFSLRDWRVLVVLLDHAIVVFAF